MDKQRLVVVGNGMAGARTVEEILARGGGDQFDITMFGDEPYGNYNRILLSNVVNGSQDASEIFPQQSALVQKKRAFACTPVCAPPTSNGSHAWSTGARRRASRWWSRTTS